MKHKILLIAGVGLLAATIACNSSEFNLTVDAIESGAVYVCTVEKAPASCAAQVQSDGQLAESIFAGYQAGKNTAQDVQNAITDLQQHLVQTFQALGIKDPNTQALATLTINEAASLLNFIVQAQSGTAPPPPAVPSAKFKASFNAVAGQKVLH